MPFEKFIEQYGIELADYEISQKGVKRITANKVESVCLIPILPTAILQNVDNQVEKVELTFIKRNKERKVIVDRSVVANKSSIIKLADKGVEVNSSNASSMVKYISDIVAMNVDTLPYLESKTVMGWQGNEFMPYTNTLAFDGDDQYKFLYESISSKGTLEEWCEFVKPLRNKIELRLCMASAFASPIIELIGENPFVFHVWGQSGTAKTVTLLVAMSIYGNPALGKMVRTMNMTANSMLSTAAFLKHLPFAGDELQTIKSRWANYDQLIMCITEGIDRGRMSFDKINEIKTWKCSFIFSGEEPCTKQESGGGVKNRVIEVELKGRAVENGNQVANYVRNHYGCAGKPFIEKLSSMDDLHERHLAMFQDILSKSDTTDKQAGTMALIMLADQIASEMFWTDEEPLKLEDIQQYMFTENDANVAERAYQYVCSEIAIMTNNFEKMSKEVWGRKTETDLVYINCNVLKRLLEKASFDIDACKSYWVSHGYMLKSPKGRLSHCQRIDNTVTRCYLLNMNASGEIPDDLDSDDDELPL